MPKRQNKSLDKLFWDKNAGRWRHRSKSTSGIRRSPLASPDTMDRVMEEDLAWRIREMQKDTDQLIKKKIDISTWQTRIARQTKYAHKSMFRLGRGNPRSLTEKEQQTLDKSITRQLRRIQAVGTRLETSGGMSDRNLQNWVRGMGEGAKSSYSKSALLYGAQAGARYGARILGKCADHCPQCLYHASRGIVPISQMIPIGVACDCRYNCCCRNVTGSRAQVRAFLRAA